MDKEKIVFIFGMRFGYFKLFNDQGQLENEKHVWIDGGEFKRIFWRFYRLI